MPKKNVLERLERTGVRTDTDVVELVDALIGKPLRRQCWLLFLGDDGVQIHLLVPIDDLPAEPADGDADQLAATVADVIASTEATRVVIAWERPGATGMDQVDWAWAFEARDALTVAGVRLRAQVLVDARGVDTIELEEPDVA